MITRWGQQLLEASEILADYPRPHMRRRSWVNLNGLWQYAVAPVSSGLPSTWAGEIRVPFCIESLLSGVQQRITGQQRLWYRRQLEVADNTARTLLHFGAVDYDCSVWVNGGLVGGHVGGSTSFSLDISDYLTKGMNELVIAVADPTSASDQPRGKQHLNPSGIWYTPVSGIWQTVWMEQVPRAHHIDALKVTPTRKCDAVEVIAYLYRPSRDPSLAVELTISLDNKVVNRTIGRANRKILLTVPDAQLWSPQHPILYDLNVRLIRVTDPLPARNDQQQPAQLIRQTPLRGSLEAALYGTAQATGEVIDEVDSYFGLRHITVGPHPSTGEPTLLLNSEPVFQLGTLDQGWWPDGLLTPPGDEAILFELRYLKSAGFNTVRKHIKIESARYYYHCDRLGLLVWQDMPSGFIPSQFVAPNDEDEDQRSPRSALQFTHELQEMIVQLAHHPSIVMWVLHNEGWGQFDTLRLTQLIQGLDDTRIINASSGWLDLNAGDVIDKHDYAAQPSPPEPDGRRALVVGEYGGVGWPVTGHLWNPEMRNWGYQTFHSAQEAQQAYLKATNAILHMRAGNGLSGAIYTQTSDVEGEVNGLLTYDRAVEKFDPDWLLQVHTPGADSG
ncbi:MAG: glycoside hydrolase family 2 protein [bacterium]